MVRGWNKLRAQKFLVRMLEIRRLLGVLWRIEWICVQEPL